MCRRNYQKPSMVLKNFLVAAEGQNWGWLRLTKSSNVACGASSHGALRRILKLPEKQSFSTASFVCDDAEGY